MLNRIGSFFAKIAIPAIIKNLRLDIDTVHRKGGYFLRVIVEAFSIKLVDEYIHLSGETVKKPQSEKEVLTLEDPIDVIRTNQLDPFGNLNEIGK